MRRALHAREQLQDVTVAQLTRSSVARVVRHKFHRTVQDALVGHLQFHRGGKDMKDLVVGNFVLFHLMLRLVGAKARAAATAVRPAPRGEAAALTPHGAVLLEMKHLARLCIHEANKVVNRCKTFFQLTRFRYAEPCHSLSS